MDKRIKFYSQNAYDLPPKLKVCFSHLKQGIKELHGKYFWFRQTRPTEKKNAVQLSFVGYTI